MQLDDVRNEALSLPEAEEDTHFGLPSFTVRGKGFVTVQKGETHAIVSVPEAEATALAADDPGVFEAIWRSGSIFVGVRVDLALVAPDISPRCSVTLGDTAHRNASLPRILTWATGSRPTWESRHAGRSPMPTTPRSANSQRSPSGKSPTSMVWVLRRSGGCARPSHSRVEASRTPRA